MMKYVLASFVIALLASSPAQSRPDLGQTDVATFWNQVNKSRYKTTCEYAVASQVNLGQFERKEVELQGEFWVTDEHAGTLSVAYPSLLLRELAKVTFKAEVKQGSISGFVTTTGAKQGAPISLERSSQGSFVTLEGTCNLSQAGNFVVVRLGPKTKIRFVNLNFSRRLP